MKQYLFIFIILINVETVSSQLKDFYNLKHNPKKIKVSGRLKYIFFTHIYEFDKGKLKKEICKRNFKISYINEYRYDTLENLIQEIELKPYKKNDTLSTVNYEYIYDNKKAIKIIKTYNNAVINIRDSIIYDEKSRIVAFIELIPNKKTPFYNRKYYHNLSYNQQGFVETMKGYYKIGNKIEDFLDYRFDYNNNGDIIKVSTSQKLSNNPIETEVIIYKYKYDKNLNWTKRFIIKDDKFVLYQKRKIVY